MITLNFSWKRVNNIIKMVSSQKGLDDWFYIGRTTVHDGTKVDFRNITFCFTDEKGAERHIEVRVEGDDIARLHEWTKP